METEDYKVASKSYQTDKNQTIKKMWEIIAQRPSEFDMQIVDALKDTIYDILNVSKSNKETKYGCYGESIYLDTIRDLLVNFKNKDSKQINFLI